MSEAMIVREEESAAMVADSPKEMIRRGAEQASAIAELIEKQKLFSVIGGKKYVRVEGWVPIARMNGVIPREVETVENDDGSFVSVVALVKVTDGTEITQASAECGGPSEPMWQDRPKYARRSMAQTRATGKACRLAYSWIQALAGFEPTPAEEMMYDENPAPRTPTSSNRDYPRNDRPPDQEVIDEDGEWTGTITEVRDLKSGKRNGEPWTLRLAVGGDGTEFTTFDDKLTHLLTSAANDREDGTRQRIKITWQRDRYGKRQIRRVEDAEGLFDE